MTSEPMTAERRAAINRTMNAFEFKCNGSEAIRDCLREIERLEDRLDLMCDEFKRIVSICKSDGSPSEIVGICERGQSDIKQHVPVIKQRDNALSTMLSYREQLLIAEAALRIAAEDGQCYGIVDKRGLNTLVKLGGEVKRIIEAATATVTSSRLVIEKKRERLG